MLKSHTLSVRPSLLLYFSLNSFLSFLCGGFFKTRLDKLSLSASEGIIVFVQQPLREGLNSTCLSALFYRPQWPPFLDSCHTSSCTVQRASIFSSHIFLATLDVESRMH